MLTAINLHEAFDQVSEYWFPKVIGEVNGQLLKVAKLKGELVWHSHALEDELFLVVRGALRIDLQDGACELKEGDFVTVPAGVPHNPIAENECWVLLIEPRSTLHTGDVTTESTRSLEQQMR